MPLGPPSNRNDTGTWRISEICWIRLAPPLLALLVFLHLLEGEPQCFAEFFLAHAEHDPAHAHATADIFVNRVGRFRHFKTLLGIEPGTDSTFRRISLKEALRRLGTVKFCAAQRKKGNSNSNWLNLFSISVARLRMPRATCQRAGCRASSFLDGI